MPNDDVIRWGPIPLPLPSTWSTLQLASSEAEYTLAKCVSPIGTIWPEVRKSVSANADGPRDAV